MRCTFTMLDVHNDAESLVDKQVTQTVGFAGFDVNKVGDARVGLVGFPSVGKSTLLTKLTGTMSEVRSE